MFNLKKMFNKTERVFETLQGTMFSFWDKYYLSFNDSLFFPREKNNFFC